MKKLIVSLLAVACLLLIGCTNSHDHSYNMDHYAYNDTHHWHSSACEHQEEIKDKGEHSFDAEGLCTVCDYSSPYEMKLVGTYYKLSGVKANLTGEITLPETYNGLPVKEINVWGFSANDGVGSTNGVTKVIIPDCYEKIGANAFDNMPNLKTVIIGNGVKEIGSGAFESCTNLENVSFGNAVEAIYAEAFQYCEKLDNVVFPASLKEITYRAFGYCKSLKSIVIPKGVTKMLADVFYENDSLTDIYCEIDSDPGWDPEWCGNYRNYHINNDVKVTFGYGSDHPTVMYCVCFDKIGGSYETTFADRESYLYAAGNEISFYLAINSDVENVAMYVNGVRHSIGIEEEILIEGSTKAFWKYTFTMPEGHVVISFQIIAGNS